MSFEAFMKYVADELKQVNIVLPPNNPMWIAIAMAWRNGQHPDKAVALVRNFYGIMKEGTH